MLKQPKPFINPRHKCYTWWCLSLRLALVNGFGWFSIVKTVTHKLYFAHALLFVWIAWLFFKKVQYFDPPGIRHIIEILHKFLSKGIFSVWDPYRLAGLCVKNLNAARTRHFKVAPIIAQFSDGLLDEINITKARTANQTGISSNTLNNLMRNRGNTSERSVIFK